ncbi:DUF3300 domain-containing protein [Isoalcanivorax indicus]|uniref:DUF3300 domain-containing protein n=1 Tax=Isoalcanivorax indicus TaxID=2202653 RepID=UPI0013C4523B|nr:DUF3300 domain-containing protein [Isoalcanivorax indicus]
MTRHTLFLRPTSRWLTLLLSGLLLASLSAYLRAQDELFSQAELDQMLAPVALFPDSLLSQVLIAATYPLEVVDAARWSAANPDLSGGDAVRAVERRDWDPAVKSLVAFPDLLARMDRDLDWTRRLGDAWLMQEADVSDSIQALRRRAESAGHLRQDEHIRTRRERDVIIIEQARPQVVYVPYYRTTVVYGPWWHPAYPPVYWHPPVTTSAVFYWGSGVRLYSNFFFTRFDWPRRNIVIINAHQPPQYHVHYHGGRPPRGGYTRWRHNPQHRRGVTYRSPALNRDFTRHTASIDANRRPVWQRDQAARNETRRETRPEPGQWRGNRDGARRDGGRRDAADNTRRMRPPATPDTGREQRADPQRPGRDARREDAGRRDTRSGNRQRQEAAAPQPERPRLTRPAPSAGGERTTTGREQRQRRDASQPRQSLTGDRSPGWQRGNSRGREHSVQPRQQSDGGAGRGPQRSGRDGGQRGGGNWQRGER